jgi:hypothetical protein
LQALSIECEKFACFSRASLTQIKQYEGMSFYSQAAPGVLLRRVDANRTFASMAFVIPVALLVIDQWHSGDAAVSRFALRLSAFLS